MRSLPLEKLSYMKAKMDTGVEIIMVVSEGEDGVVHPMAIITDQELLKHIIPPEGVDIVKI